MARRGDGIYQRGKTWWLDFTHRGGRHVVRLGKNISRTVAGELARVQRGAILKGEAGIGGPKHSALHHRCALTVPDDEALGMKEQDRPVIRWHLHDQVPPAGVHDCMQRTRHRRRVSRQSTRVATRGGVRSEAARG